MASSEVATPYVRPRRIRTKKNIRLESKSATHYMAVTIQEHDSGARPRPGINDPITLLQCHRSLDVIGCTGNHRFTVGSRTREGQTRVGPKESGLNLCLCSYTVGREPKTLTSQKTNETARIDNIIHSIKGSLLLMVFFTILQTRNGEIIAPTIHTSPRIEYITHIHSYMKKTYTASPP